MKRLKLLWKVIKRINFDKVLYGFLAWYVITSVLIMEFEPEITNIKDAMWYTFVACTSIGFGDFVPVTVPGRMLTIVMTVYEVLIVAMFSGVVVSYYLEVVHRREQGDLMALLDKLEVLTELSNEELQNIEDKIKKLRE